MKVVVGKSFFEFFKAISVVIGKNLFSSGKSSSVALVS